MSPRDDRLSFSLCGSTRIKATRRLKPQGIALLAAVSIFAVRQFLGQPDISLPDQPTHQIALSKYRSMVYPLANSQLVGLYFGASYYEENRLLRDAFSRDPRLLPSEGLIRKTKEDNFPLAIVYVPSDDVEGSSEWITVTRPDERAALQRKFHCCTNQECSTLSIDQRFPVPSLFVIDSRSMGVISPMGLDDIKRKGSDALHDWLQFQESIVGVDPSVWAASELFRDDDYTTTNASS